MQVTIVEGIIGAGKSTLCSELAAELGPNTLTLLEPAEDTNPYLADYYKNPERWSFAIQIHLLQARYRMHLQGQWHVMNGCGNAIYDRSYFGDVAFAYIQRELGYMTEREFTTYRQIYRAMTAGVLFPGVCVVLNVSPEVALSRIRRRMAEKSGRKCETAVTVDYLVRLQDRIRQVTDLLANQGTTVIPVDWDENRDLRERHFTIERLAREIQAAPQHSSFPDLHKRLIE